MIIKSTDTVILREKKTSVLIQWTRLINCLLSINGQIEEVLRGHAFMRTIAFTSPDCDFFVCFSEGIDTQS